MLEHAVLLKLSTQNPPESTASQLRQEYQAYQRLFQEQPTQVKQYLRNQAATIATAMMNGTASLHFSLPEHVVCLPFMDCDGVDEIVPQGAREQRVGSLLDRLAHHDLMVALSQRLSELERSNNRAVAGSAGLTRYAVAIHIIYEMLPAGNAVVYAAPADGDIPNQPVATILELKDDYRVSTGCQPKAETAPAGQLEALPDANYANGFFLPQHVSFDDQNRLLAGDLQTAVEHVRAIQHYLLALDLALGLAPYMVVDEGFQTRRYGVLGQLVNQGRGLASYQVELLCQTIKRRSANHSLDRGLSLSMPYFDDRTLTIEEYRFDIIPAGRVMFTPAFVVLAVREEAKKILQDTRLSQPTRRSLLRELCAIERAFLR